jgi:hypothetical protein
MYAQMDMSKGWPDGYEEVEWLAKELRQYDITYKVHVERKMLSHQDGAEFVVAIIRWEGSKYHGDLKRTLLATYDNISEATGMLRLLIGNAKAERSLNMYS